MRNAIAFLVGGLLLCSPAIAAEKSVDCFSDADATVVLKSMKKELSTSSLKTRVVRNLERIERSLSNEQVHRLQDYGKQYEGAEAQVLQGQVALELSKIIGSNACNQEISPATPDTVNMTCTKKTSYGFLNDQIITNNDLGEIISTSTKLVRVPLSNGVVFEYEVKAQTEDRYMKRDTTFFALELGFIERPEGLWIKGQTIEDAGFRASGAADLDALTRIVKERQHACLIK